MYSTNCHTIYMYLTILSFSKVLFFFHLKLYSFQFVYLYIKPNKVDIKLYKYIFFILSKKWSLKAFKMYKKKLGYDQMW